MDSEERVDAAVEYLNSFQRTAAAVGDLVNAVVTGPARPKNARSLSATNRDEPRTPKYISETLNSFSTSLVPCKTTSRKRARARAAENPKIK